MDLDARPLAGKKLLLLDGSRKSIEIVDEAHRLGVHVIVTDYNTPEQSPAKLAADQHFQVSTSDVDAVVGIRVERVRVAGQRAKPARPANTHIVCGARRDCTAAPVEVDLWIDPFKHGRVEKPNVFKIGSP